MRWMLFAIVVVLLTWILGGAGVYYAIGNCSQVPRHTPDGGLEEVEICPWRFSQSLYFSVQTGLSIGFGLINESHWISEAYSCFHILAGSSFIVGTLSFFVTQALAVQQGFQSRSERRLADASLALHAQGYDGFTLAQIRELMVMHPQYANAIIRKVHPQAQVAHELIHQFKVASKDGRETIATEVLKDACHNLEEFKHDSLKIQDLLAIDEEYAGRWRKFMRGVRNHASMLTKLSVLALWICVGALFSHFHDEHDFVTSVYFAISTMSTAGMVSTTKVEGDAHFLFVAFYAVVGVPLYGVTLGSFANVLVQRFILQQTQEALDQRLSAAEVEFLGHLAGRDADKKVDLAEYTELQLLRLGTVDRETLRQIRERFQLLDVGATGLLDKTDILHAHHLAALGGGQSDASAPSTPPRDLAELRERAP